MARFSGIPALPDVNVDEWQTAVLGAIKQNVELLTGGRGESDEASRALLKGDLSVSQAGDPKFVQLSARGAGFTVSGASVPALADYVSLLQDVQALAADVAELRTVLNTLVSQLRS